MTSVDNCGWDRRTILKRSAIAGSLVFGTGAATAAKGGNPGNDGRSGTSGREGTRGNEHTGGRILLDREPPDAKYFNGDRPRFFARSVSDPVETPSFVEEAETDQPGPCVHMNGRRRYKIVLITWEINEIPPLFGKGAIRENDRMEELFSGGGYHEIVNYGPCSRVNDLYIATYRPGK